MPLIQKTLSVSAGAAIAATLTGITSAQISLESAGLPTTNLNRCPQKVTLNYSQFYQYKVIGYFSQLKLEASQAQPHTAHSMPLIAWSRLTLRGNNGTFPIDIFKSSRARNQITGHEATPCAAWHAEEGLGNTVIAIDGNTSQTKGYVVLCVDFVPVPPRPRGKIRLARSSVRDGEKAPLTWLTQR